MEWGIYYRIVMHRELSLRVTGFIASLILTLAAYFIILNPDFFHFDIKTAIIVIFIFALVQALAQLIFFINVWKEKGPLWNLSVFISTVSIIFVIIFFSVWIMNHLNYNMR
jgi:cytochrome o ubiquinol oxidase operon protein cyoD